MIASAIIATLTYSDHFGFPLTLSEIHTRLIKEKVASRRVLDDAIKHLVQSDKIGKTGDYYHLCGRSSLISRRKEKASISTPQLERAKHLAKQIGIVPGIMAVYLTGSLAMSNSQQLDDIDLMIITKNNRLWTTRLLVTIYTELLGLRRRPNSTKNSGKVCLNLYLCPKSYNLPPVKRSLYSAYELIQALPLIDPTGTHDSLLSSNLWLQDYLPNIIISNKVSSRTANQSEKSNRLYDDIEKLAYWIQRKYMKSKITREYITKDSAFFHPKDPGAKVLKKLL